MSVFLTYPPFASPYSPYLSIPILTAYLRSRNIEVSAVDANVEFFRWILSSGKVNNGKRFAESRIVELNEKPELCFTEMAEFAWLIRSLHGIQGINTSLLLASCPYFPEAIHVMHKYNFIKYLSPFHEYSTGDIFRSLKSKSMLDGFFEFLLTPLLKDRAPDIVGISVCFSDQVLSAFRCAMVVRKILPQAHITLGGPFVSCHMGRVEEKALFGVIDSMVIDDGELPLERLDRELSGDNPDFSRVPGLIYMSDGKICRNKPAEHLNMEKQPPADYLAFPLDRYLGERKGISLPFRFSRGCPWAHCAFCRTELSMVSKHQQPCVDYLYSQLKAVVEQTGVRNFNITDEASSPEVLESLSQKIIDGNLHINWTVNLRFDPALTLERCMLMRKAGCVHICLGLESYNDRLLRLIRKGIDINLINRVLSNISWAGIVTFVYMIVGLPTETEEEALDSYNSVKKMFREGLIKQYIYNQFQVLSFSPMAGNPEKYGISRTFVSEKLDLDPPVFEFESSGMSRRTASELKKKFNISMPGLPQELKVNGQDLPLNYNMAEIQSILNSNAGNDLSIGEWLESGEKGTGLLKQSHNMPRA